MTAETLFADDFTGATLDRTKWNVFTTGAVFNDEQQAYVDTPETVAIESGPDGGRHLALRPHHRPGFETADGGRFDFVSGRLDTRGRFSFRYGTAAARIKLPAGPGLWPAFWALGPAPWPDGGELDTMEYVGDPRWVSAGVHGPGYSGEGGLVDQFHFPVGEDATGWHVYAVDWSRDEVVFLVDDRVTSRVTRPMAGFHGPWAFDREMHLVLNVAVGGIYPFKMNGITTPAYGLSDAALASIRAGDAAMLVDWVRVTQSAQVTA